MADPTDQENVNCVVVKRVKAKIEGNNEIPYRWDQFRSDCFFGQSIISWIPIYMFDSKEETYDKM